MTVYDRSAEDVSNLMALEHVNLQVPDQSTATAFYITGLGFTRDPYMMTGTQFMWVNLGRSQFHLMAGSPQRVSGTIGLVVPSLSALITRLEAIRTDLAGTEFSFDPKADTVEVTCPWGNHFRCHAPGALSPRMALGMPYIEFDVPPGSAEGIANFYHHVFDNSVYVDSMADAVNVARVPVGIDQELLFRETHGPIRAFDGHHIQVYVANFSGPHRRLIELGLLTEESNAHQYRFDTITDLATQQPLLKVEHEVRSLRHPLYARPLVNRNPEQVPTAYAQGLDQFVPPDMSRDTDDPRLKSLMAERKRQRQEHR